MKKSKKILLVSIAILAVVMSFIGGQVYAKYMSQVTGNGTADIASWSFKVNDKDERMQTITLKSTINNATLANNKIAPGTQGSFQIKLDTSGSDVGINYKILIENETRKPTNLKFEFNNHTYNTISEFLNGLTGTINSNETEKVLTINWSWPYTTGSSESQIASNDALDTQEAKSIQTYTFDVIVTGTQVVPNA